MKNLIGTVFAVMSGILLIALLIKFLVEDSTGVKTIQRSDSCIVDTTTVPTRFDTDMALINLDSKYIEFTKYADPVTTDTVKFVRIGKMQNVVLGGKLSDGSIIKITVQIFVEK